MVSQKKKRKKKEVLVGSQLCPGETKFQSPKAFLLQTYAGVEGDGETWKLFIVNLYLFIFG